MNIENIIRAWKADEEDQDTLSVANPVGEELTDQELLDATGGFCNAFQTCATVTIIRCSTGSLM